MPVGITNTTAVSMNNLTDLVNFSSVPEFLVKINTIVYDGYLWFILLWVLWVILYAASQQVRDQPLNNAMYSGAVISIASFILRGIQVVVAGNLTPLLTDHQLWVFPLITVLIVLIVWGTKE